MQRTTALAGGGLLSILFAIALSPGCRGTEPSTGGPGEARKQEVLAEVDTVMTELGGEATAQLSRGQRWRMVSSVGAGLPPATYKVEDLPEPDSRGAKLIQAYCVQCHAVPAPQMHSAAEWPILMRRMEMRAETLHRRMGGPVVRGLLGDILMSGMASAVVPPPQDADSLRAYLERHAMPAARPGEIGTGAEAELFVQRCGTCHEPPAPSAHTAEEWPDVIGKMRANMALMSVAPMSDEEQQRIVSFLQGRAGGR